MCLNYQTIPFFYKNVLQEKKKEKRQRQGGRQCFNIFSSLLLMELPTLLTLFSYAALNIFFFLSKSGFQELQISKILLSSILLSFLFFFFCITIFVEKGAFLSRFYKSEPGLRLLNANAIAPPLPEIVALKSSGFVCHEFYTTNVQGRKG